MTETEEEKKFVFRCKRCGKYDRQAKGRVVQRATVEITGAVHSKVGGFFVPKFESHQTAYYYLAPDADLCCVSCHGEVEFIEFDPSTCPHNFEDWKSGHIKHVVNRHCRACGKWEQGLVDLDSIKEMN